MKKMKIAKEITTIICDDARQEIGGKISLMGVYSGDIVVNNIPAILPMFCLVAILVGIKREFSKLKSILTIPNSKPVEFNMPAPSNLEIGTNSNLILALTPFKIESPGKGKFEIFVDEEDKPSIKHNFTIVLNEST